MDLMNFVTPLHISNKRNYLERMTAEKPECMRVAKQFGRDYWDGFRCFGYGGYIYIPGKWTPVAKAMVKHYGLEEYDKILDIGCGKGSLLKEFYELGLVCSGIDISLYAFENSFHPIGVFNCIALPKCAPFDFTYSINVFHNLGYKDLKQAIREMVRVSKPDGHSYICVESYRNEEELCNLQCWALTCASFYTPNDWLQIYEDCGYKGDYEFIYFN